MIALPNYKRKHKISTLNKAGTLLSVSPISSNRNVMVKVKDNATHAGRKYKTCECGFVGFGVKDFPSKKTGKCRKCHEKHRIEKYTVKCRGCEKRISTSLKKPYCSHECRTKHKPVKHKVVEIECCVCLKKALKRINVTEPNKPRCCSQECQTQYAFIINHSTSSESAKDRIDWISRSKHAKSQWIKRRSKERINKSVNGLWARKCASQLRDETYHFCEWNRRCINSAKGLNQRLWGSGDRKRKKIKTFSELCSLSVVAKFDYSLMDEWSKKCYSTQKNMKWRRRLRSVNWRISTHIKEKDPQPKQRSLWEWIEGQPVNN